MEWDPIQTMMRFWAFLRMLFLEGMMHRTAAGETLGARSRRSRGANMMLSGVIGFAICTVWFAQRAQFEVGALSATAEVLEVRRERSSSGGAVYELTLAWTDRDGLAHVTVPGCARAPTTFPSEPNSR